MIALYVLLIVMYAALVVLDVGLAVHAFKDKKMWLGATWILCAAMWAACLVLNTYTLSLHK